jgi:uncharacterized protein (DUF952 family)
MIYHVVTRHEWHTDPDRPYVPASLAREGFLHCSPDPRTAVAVANAFYRTAPRPLLALVIDETRLTARCAWEPADPAPPPGVPEGTLFPHVYGPLDRAAVTGIAEIQWDEEGRATGLGDTAPGF